MDACITGGSKERLHLYSGHDTTVLPLLSGAEASAIIAAGLDIVAALLLILGQRSSTRFPYPCCFLTPGFPLLLANQLLEWTWITGLRTPPT